MEDVLKGLVGFLVAGFFVGLPVNAALIAIGGSFLLQKLAELLAGNRA